MEYCGNVGITLVGCNAWFFLHFHYIEFLDLIRNFKVLVSSHCWDRIRVNYVGGPAPLCECASILFLLE